MVEYSDIAAISIGVFPPLNVDARGKVPCVFSKKLGFASGFVDSLGQRAKVSWSPRHQYPARVAELADALASGASVLIGRAGSSPAPGTL